MTMTTILRGPSAVKSNPVAARNSWRDVIKVHPAAELLEPPGWYRFIGIEGRLYVVNIRPSIKGAKQTACLYRPIIRVAAGLNEVAQ
jgi:hypothetical protein